MSKALPSKLPKQPIVYGGKLENAQITQLSLYVQY